MGWKGTDRGVHRLSLFFPFAVRRGSTRELSESNGLNFRDWGAGSFLSAKRASMAQTEGRYSGLEVPAKRLGDVGRNSAAVSRCRGQSRARPRQAESCAVQLQGAKCIRTRAGEIRRRYSVATRCRGWNLRASAHRRSRQEFRRTGKASGGVYGTDLPSIRLHTS